MNQRVVITGMGVVAPNAVGLTDFLQAIETGRSGIQFLPELAEKNFGCCIGGVPQLSDALMKRHFSDLELRQFTARNLLYGILASEEAWTNAGLEKREEADPDWETGCIFGVGLSGARTIRRGVYLIDEGNVKRMGSTTVTQTMPSGISAQLSGRFGLGNWVFTNASACSSGTEALRLGAEYIRTGRAKRMLCGACDTDGPYIWGGFDAMRVLTRKYNDHPEAGSRPMSASASGFVPGAGAGAFVLESLESALDRGAPVLAEVVGGFSNAGGHRRGGSMTAPNPAGIQRCIEGALATTGVDPAEIDAISGHLTATMGDPLEINAWVQALGRSGAHFPLINSLKSMIGHCLSGAGAIESVAVVLQLQHGFVHATLNCEDVHPSIRAQISENSIPHQSRAFPEIRLVAKSSFGFGDVNSVILFKKFTSQ